MSLPKIVVGGLVVLVVAVVAAGAGWWVFIREDAKPRTSSQVITEELKTAVATSVAQAGETPAAAGGTLAFQIVPEQSTASYYAGETLASVGLPSTAQGTTNEIEGTIYLTEDGLALHPENPTVVTVGLTNLTSDQERRDNRVRDALQVSAYPAATFTVTGVSGVDASLPAEEEHTFQMTGILDLHGVQKEVTWEVKARREGDIMTALATVTVLYADFGITPPNIAGFVSVEDDVTLQMDIVATQAS
jgi:polyisoprenoid-binding protein YceI